MAPSIYLFEACNRTPAVCLGYVTGSFDAIEGNGGTLFRSLRQHAATARANDAIDWPNIIEEIEDVGRSSLRAVRSDRGATPAAGAKAEAWPTSRDVPHWRAEARLHRDQARDDYTASMAAKIDMVKLYRQALRAMPETMDEQPPLPVPEACPVTLDEMVASPPDDISQ
jgi:Domain of unknown function DUF29